MLTEILNLNRNIQSVCFKSCVAYITSLVIDVCTQKRSNLVTFDYTSQKTTGIKFEDLFKHEFNII